ncbi:hypothetical protein HZZ00_04605 [Streptomyces sp. NEAU-sy36]|uniref:hypothetical protein n=1 Tax=unclassified Streptomyces TaxID=2593676 RepID=UPI0015D5E661|nr:MULTISPECIES: hypothetical protein [unclassified Streptomyces]QLJ00334.1 hypothetical protein HZZ00_04605 [Streptomyces sp. NEAU-sy36]
MRALPARRLASTVVGAAVLAAVTGPVAVAVSADSTGDRADTGASRTALPGAAKLLAQVRAMDRNGSVPKQVVTLLDRSLTEGRLPAAEARRLGDEAKKALERAAAAGTLATPTAAAEPTAPATPTAPAATPATTPATPTATASAVPAQPATASAPAVAPSGSESQSAMPKPAASAAKHGATRAVPAARDLLGDVLAAVDALVNAVVSQVDQVVSNAKNLVDLLLASLNPTPTATPTPAATPSALPNLPALPSLPATG